MRKLGRQILRAGVCLSWCGLAPKIPATRIHTGVETKTDDSNQADGALGTIPKRPGETPRRAEAGGTLACALIALNGWTTPERK